VAGGYWRQAIADLAFWPIQYALGLYRVAAFNSLGLALRLTAYNLFGIKQLFRLRLYGVDLSIRSGTPDLVVAMESLGTELEIITKGVEPPGAGLIIDAGGYIGTSAIKFATAFPLCKIISVEPSTENLAMLRHNVANYPNISVLHAALSADGAEATLRAAGSGEWGFTILARSSAGDPGGGDIERVPSTTIEQILAHEQIDRLFVLKLDVEGAELEIFLHAGPWMARIDIVIAELHEKLAPGAEAAFAAATVGRTNRHLPGEKLLSLRAGVVCDP
jgi:FkbM family methyltransferase